MNREKLIEAGVDYDEGVERFGEQPVIFEKYLARFFEGTLMKQLEQKLLEHDIAGAFRTAHDLKGAAGNLSLNCYYECICSLTELLRRGDSASDCAPLLERAKVLYYAAKQAAEEDRT